MNLFARSLLLFLLLVTFDGAIRKWALPGQQQLVLIAKDALLVGLLFLAVFFTSRQKGRIELPTTVGLTLGLYSVWVFLECFNPSLPNLAVAIWGAKSHLLYAAFIVLVPLAFASTKDVYLSLVKLYPLLAIPVCTLAVLQVFATPDSYVNKQIYDDPTLFAYFGDANLVRVSGTFSFISGMTAFQIVLALFGIALYIAGARSLPFLAGLAFVIMTLPTTGSRGVIVTVAAGGLILVGASLVTGLMNARAAALGLVLCLAVGVLSSVFVDEVWQALFERASATAYDNEVRVFRTFANAFDFIDISGAAGFGSGAANYGSLALAPNVRPFSWLPNVGFEEEAGRIVLELGWVGLILSLALRLSLLGWALLLLFSGRTREIQFTAALALPFMALGLYQGQGVFAATYLQAAYWFCVALLAMAEAEQARQMAPCSTPSRTQVRAA